MSGPYPTPPSPRRRRRALPGNTNARRHGLYSARAVPSLRGVAPPPAEVGSSSIFRASSGLGGTGDSTLARAHDDLQRLLAYQDTLDPAANWARYQAAQTLITRLFNTVHRLRKARRAAALAQRRLELAARKRAVRQQRAAYAARKVPVAKQRQALDPSPARPPRSAAGWQRFNREGFEHDYSDAHPGARPPVQPLAEKNENMEEQFACPPAPIRPAQDAPADATRQTHPSVVEKYKNIEEQFARLWDSHFPSETQAAKRPSGLAQLAGRPVLSLSKDDGELPRRPGRPAQGEKDKNYEEQFGGRLAHARPGLPFATAIAKHPVGKHPRGAHSRRPHKRTSRCVAAVFAQARMYRIPSEASGQPPSRPTRPLQKKSKILRNKSPGARRSPFRRAKRSSGIRRPSLEAVIRRPAR